MTRKFNLLAGVAMTAAERATGRYMRAPDEHPAAPPPVEAPAPVAVEPPAPAPAEPPAPAAAPNAPPAEAPSAFEAAFAAEAALSLPEAKPEAKPAAAPAPAAAPPEAKPAAAAPEVPPAAAPPPEAKPAAPALPTAEEIVAGLAKVIGERPIAAPAAPAAPAAAPAEPAPIYTPDEAAVLTEYEKNWPDVARAESLKRRAEYSDMFKYIFSEVHNFTKPLFDQVQAMGNSLHTGELKTLVPDYTPDLEVQVGSWVDTQPAYLQAAYRQVMQSGTSDEVADLIGRYKAQTGVAPAPQAPAAPAAPAAPVKPPVVPKTELSSAAIQAAASLAPVGGERTQVPQGEDPQDFLTAFAKYAAAG